MTLLKTIRIGTRDSRLALWQAEQVQQSLTTQGFATELVPVKSEGDLDLVTPLYAMGVEGVFTKTLDAHLLSNRIDIAVHSMKDVPTQLAQGISQAAVLKRASYKDILVVKDQDVMHTFSDAHIIATGSVRRKAQWLNRYAHHSIEQLRGNVQTRLQKLQDHNWSGAIFAAAGLERIGIRPETAIDLDWMLPAPAQGAIMVVCRSGEADLQQACALMNDADTEVCVRAERAFLSALMGGCATPISALATLQDGKMVFKGSVLSPDGKEKIEIEEVFETTAIADAGHIAAAKIIAAGADRIIAKLNRKAG